MESSQKIPKQVPIRVLWRYPSGRNLVVCRENAQTIEDRGCVFLSSILPKKSQNGCLTEFYGGLPEGEILPHGVRNSYKQGWV